MWQVCCIWCKGILPRPVIKNTFDMMHQVVKRFSFCACWSSLQQFLTGISKWPVPRPNVCPNLICINFPNFSIFILFGIFQNLPIEFIVNLFYSSTTNQSIIDMDVLIQQNFLLMTNDVSFSAVMVDIILQFDVVWLTIYQ